MWSRVPRSAGTPWLIAGAALSAAAALLHVGVIVGGPDWYRFFGAGERMAQMAERGHWYPPVITIGIAIVLSGWALVALSAAGLALRVPLLRTGLAAITAIYLARGLLIVPVVMFVPYPEGAFDYWSSLIVLVYGLVYAIGLWLAWPALRPRPKSSIA
jgi:hypothetical protein